MNVDHLVSSLGYWAVFLLVAAESLGVPLPGETARIVAGAYAGQPQTSGSGAPRSVQSGHGAASW